MEPQKTLNSQRNLEKEMESCRYQILDFKLYYKATVIETVWYWQKKKQTHRSTELNRKFRNELMIIWLTFDKVGKNIQSGKDSLFNKWCQEN